MYSFLLDDLGGILRESSRVTLSEVRLKPISCEIVMVGVDIYPLPPTAFRRTPLAESSNSVMVYLDCAPESSD